MSGVGMMQLNDGNLIPCLGLGLWLVSDADAPGIMRSAAEAGYRLFDTAMFYKNETGVGRGIREIGVPRKDLFITTKLWNARHGYDETLRAFDESMERLGLEYLDLYLIHWPVAGSEKYLDSWRAFIRLREEGRVRSIGVSNFLARHLKRLVETTGIVPAVNQIEYHPRFQQPAVAEENRRLGIITECWAPFGRGGALDNPVIAGIAARLGKSPAQVILRWHLDKGFVAIPKTSHPGRMRENLAVFDFALTAEDAAAIDAIGVGGIPDGDPDVFTGLDLK